MGRPSNHLRIPQFYHPKKINAISQYFDNIYIKEIDQIKNTCLTLILSLWEKASPHVSFQNGIVDFGITSDLNHAFIIECNPLDQFTGPALFNYFEDWEVITGKSEFEFRVVDVRGEYLLPRQEGTYTSFLPEIKKAIVIQEKRKEERRIQKENEKQICRIM